MTSGEQEVEIVPFRSQFGALFRKNLVLQKRQTKTNVCQCLFPCILLLVLLLVSYLAEVLTKEDVKEIRTPVPYDVRGIYPKQFRSGKLLFVDPLNGQSVGRYDGFNKSTNDGLLKYISNSDMLFSPADIPMPPIPPFQSTTSKSAIDSYMYDIWGSAVSAMTGYLFKELDSPSMTLKYTAYYNASVSEVRGGSFGRHSAGEDLPTNMFVMVRAAYRYLMGNNATYSVKMSQLPRKADTTQMDFMPFIEPMYYTWILHFLMPVFIELIVYEKENKLRDIMRMMGLKMKIYWIVHFIFDWTLYLAVVAILIIVGFLLQFRFFTQNAFFLYFLLFVIWGFVLIAFSFVWSTVFSNTRAATIITYFYIILAGIAADVTNSIFLDEPDTSDFSYISSSVVPTFALNRALHYLSSASSDRKTGMTFESATDGRFYECLIMLAIEAILLYLLAYYLEMVLHSGSGLKKHPLFLCKKSTWSKSAREQEKQAMLKDIQGEQTFLKSFRLKGERDDVKEERTDVLKKMEENAKGVYVRKLHKRFGTKANGVVALDNVSVGVENGQCVGLLGQNGAGKTTLINILSGLYAPTHGNVAIGGFNLVMEMDTIYSFMGVCPQFDILWGDQSGREHLLFYGRLKGLSGKELEESVQHSLKTVNLSKFGDLLAKKYSGGMKRRLSVAIALIGNPRVVFLDEPTTGLDPHTRRDVWDAIIQSKEGRAMILTTHSMEEADALCDRIGIMAHGRMQCIGFGEELKKKYGCGYHLTVSSERSDEFAGVKQFVEDSFEGAKLVDSVACSATYSVPSSSVGKMSSVFQLFESNTEKLGISDWGITSSTLEDVFRRMTEEDNLRRRSIRLSMQSNKSKEDEKDEYESEVVEEVKEMEEV